MAHASHSSSTHAAHAPPSTATRPASPPARSQPVPSASVASPFTAAVIFLHGVGSTGDELHSQLFNLVQPSLEQRFPHVRFVFPTARRRSFTAFKGRVLPAWFDRAGYGLQWDEDVEGVRESCAQINDVVRQCNAEGVSNQRIVLGGFSMGGAQAMHSAYSDYGAGSPYFNSPLTPGPLAGCFCISSYLPRSCLLPSSLTSDSLVLATPLLFMHGASDSIVRPAWAEDTCRRMKQAGVLCLFNMYDKQIHALSQSQLTDLTTYIGQFLPRDVKPQPDLPTSSSSSASASSSSQSSQQQQHHQYSQSYSLSMDEQMQKFAARPLPLPPPSSSSTEVVTAEEAGMSEYLERLKPLNTDLR